MKIKVVETKSRTDLCFLFDSNSLLRLVSRFGTHDIHLALRVNDTVWLVTMVITSPFFQTFFTLYIV
jgi:hypothetical protein